ncbi:MAG: zinc carboxypeptidase [Chitinophagaceae bacterium]|nr:zinc carboxypeptidase [Chitinophagaceae bacterium]
MNIKLFSLLLLFISNGLFAQLKSPDEFLGYPLGSKFTPHYKIVNYFNQAAASLPQLMKLEKYGETNEGRDLLLAIVSTPENMARIEEIRKNNLRLTGMLKDKPADAGSPVIVWLSYNVHGNEASSSEVSMKTLYELLTPANAQTKNWLKNTVIIIDPCLNPDGRDRYVNWFNQMVGKDADANPNSREHSEPWPGGRVNHYNFDLNRDWAWQTQVETQGRIKKYNAWMPQIHCDFHEQGINNPYYFAPAAEPFHEVITKWQRDFQYTIGRNHAKYFDANGWLYFTKEIFDLFYPAYGDTYPTYNGAIGMTYEQAGHSQGGLAVVTNDGDTLSLKDRIAHHFTTSMSTIEIASQNRDKLISEFKKYFDEGNTNGTGEYKTYVVTEANAGRREALRKFFEMNGINYGSASGAAVKGYNYFSGKEEIFTAANSLAVSALQPKSALIKVLFEPKSKLSDSVTYDITAWSLPFVYGTQTFAVKEKLPLGNYNSVNKNAAVPATAYGYLVSYNSFADVKFLAALLNAKIKVRFAEKEFTANGKSFQKGTIIVLKKGNEDKLQQFADLAQTYNAAVTAVSGGFMDTGFDFGSEKVHLVKKPTVALLTGKGVNPGAAGEVWHLFDQQLNYPVSLINADEVDGSALKGIDVLILPDGNYKFLKDKDAAAEIKMWVQQGGKMIVLDNATAQVAKADWGIKLKKADDDEKKDDKKDDKNIYVDVKRYENRERDAVVNNIPGAIYKVELDNSHPLAFGYDNNYYSLKQSGDMYEFMKDGWNVGIIKKENQTSGFVGSVTREKIKDGTVMGVLPMGSGAVVFFADDPIFRNFWENGKMLLANAVFLVGQ